MDIFSKGSWGYAPLLGSRWLTRGRCKALLYAAEVDAVVRPQGTV
jgi:hypothetical protein